ncbi:TPA: hypothetical protein ACP6IN_001269 [Clostridioides difficile]|jgi:hypothetical protein|uniref:hypothetical protein n=1 Tax=Clostridioides difficile TaxID=1496 RepID=UPI001372A182|nr:hypothetical protein [Clostridioides difficile]MCJ0119737.1 hypothetical protein [Clostridioides difficile]MDB3060754.1 hypothetical protein [Clostridioides difficile]MDB3611988.1 hypothetical protein [Clostridioides difficile]MDV5911714.1 hypothetical protein [Clostridioides difficile]NAT21304.1 hypothetical protein [Clostridioides difficile]
MLTDLFNRIMEVGARKIETKEINGVTYTADHLIPVHSKPVEIIGLNTLDGLIGYIKSEFDSDAKSDRLIVHVESSKSVALYSELMASGKRNVYVHSKALSPHINFGCSLDTEEFNIMLQSSFVDTEDKNLLLKVAGNVKETSVKTVQDDGVSQVVAMSTGVASVEDVILPNRVKLKPYRTFVEVDQPESEFIFRVKEGITFKLIEADGGAWRLEAIKNIKEYLEKKLEGIENIDIIA